MRPDPPAKSPTPLREASNPPSPAISHASLAPTTRPKLNLQKRTVSEAETSSPASATSGDAKASPFGAARPIDTHAKEQEIEEKRQLALRQKKEAEEKAREEKRLAKEAAKAEKAGQEKENGGESGPAAGKQFEILTKATSGEDGATTTEAETTTKDADAGGQNGNIIDDKAVKPKEVARDAPPSKAGGAWRGKADSKEPTGDSAPAGSTTAALDEDGWSTVSKPKNNRRGGGNQGARAMAS
jgi:translation initiation factor 4B